MDDAVHRARCAYPDAQHEDAGEREAGIAPQAAQCITNVRGKFFQWSRPARVANLFFLRFHSTKSERRLTTRILGCNPTTDAFLGISLEMESDFVVQLPFFRLPEEHRADAHHGIGEEAHGVSSSVRVRRNALTASDAFSQASVSMPSCFRPAGVRR